MQNANPYNAPKAQVADARSDEVGEIKVFSASGRIGRLRYIGYTIGLPWLILIVAGFAGGLLGKATDPAVGVVIIAVCYLLALVTVVLLTIQRAHDFDKSGWLALVMIIPLVNFIFWFIPGTDGENRYGRKPPPNGVLAVIVALIVPIAIVGIIAAVALPAYQDYVKRAQTQQSQ